jgi:hypothetical protein
MVAVYENLIVFGAGASFGSDNSKCPVLATALFVTLTAKFPTSWGAIPPQFAAKFAEDFEVGMDDYIEHVEQTTQGMASISSRPLPYRLPSLNKLQADMARYFIEFDAAPQNLYRRCIAKAIARSARWPGALATLNYDLILPLSLISEGITPSIYPSTAPRTVEVCMPHGSCALYSKSLRIQGRGFSMTASGGSASSASTAEAGNCSGFRLHASASLRVTKLPSCHSFTREKGSSRVKKSSNVYAQGSPSWSW